MMIKECDGCVACCSGGIIGEAHDAVFGHGTPCAYLSESKCTIYETRPNSCRAYQCLYTQGVVPGLKNPKESGFFVTVLDKGASQYIKVHFSPKWVDKEQLSLLQNWAIENRCFVEYSDYNCENIINNFLPISKLETISSIADQVAYLGLTEATEQILIKLKSAILEDDIHAMLDVSKKMFDHKMYDHAFELLDSVDSLSSTKIILDQETQNAVDHNYILCGLKANQPEKVLVKIEKLLRQDEEEINYHLDKSYALYLNNEKEKSKEMLLDMLYSNKFKLNEEHRNKLNFNLATHKSYSGDHIGGLTNFLEYGEKLSWWKVHTIFSRPGFKEKYGDNMQPWKGEVVPGATVVLYAEAGIGDEIINVRFMNNIKELGMNPVWMNDIATRKDLVELFKQNGYQVIISPEELKQYDNILYVQGMLTPSVMNLKEDELWKGVYLKSPKEYVNKWEQLTKTKKKLKIGIRWNGQPGFDQDLHRSLNLKQLYETVKHLDAEFYSLQIDNYMDQILDFPGIIHLADKLESWQDTFGLIENLDFVISSCTSVAHATAACGTKLYVMTPITEYYTWCVKGNKTPWYGDHVTILHQQKPRSWEEPLQELRLELKQYE